MKERIKQYKRWARAALAQYDVEPSIRYIGHSENITFQVTDTPRRADYLLRIHSPISRHFLGMRQNPQVIESELAWLDALATDTDIIVPRPVRNRVGHRVSSLALEDGNALRASLLSWVQGEHIRLEEPQAVAHVRRLGLLLAKLHEHASGWQTPRGFIRPSYGMNFFQGVTETLRRGVGFGLIRERDYACIRAAIERAAEHVTGLGTSPQNWGLIHNDLHPGNCVVHGGSISPIDFSLCGLGYYLFDIGTSLGSLPQKLRPVFLEGYTEARAITDGYRPIVEGCLVITRMSYYALVLPDPSHQDWLRMRIPHVVESVCTPFLRGEPFLFDTR